MIVAQKGDQLIVTTQPDHAVFSAELLSLWRADGLPDHPRRETILFAAREHDNGWREPDAAPRVNPATGRPHTFQTIPPDLRSEIWLRGVVRFQETQPYASLLVAEHASQLLQDHRARPAWSSFFQTLDEARGALAEELAPGTSDTLAESEVSRDYRFLELADLLSLAVCSDWSSPFERSGIRFSFKEGTLSLDPFPLAGSTTFQVRYRTIPDRDYSGDADLGVELASARWQSRPIRVRPSQTSE